MMQRIDGVSVSLLLLASLYGCGGDQPAQITPEQIAELRAQSMAFAGSTAQTLLQNTQAMTLAESLFAAHCVSCHGSAQVETRRGTPNLALAVFDYGDSLDAVRTTIAQGRHSVMPKHGNKMGEVDLGVLVAYVQSFSSGEDIGLYNDAAQTLYSANCTSCHGEDGHGNAALGIPDLSDQYWQHGNAMMNVRMTITRGAESQCPAQAGTLSEIEMELLTAQVLSMRTR